MAIVLAVGVGSEFRATARKRWPASSRPRSGRRPAPEPLRSQLPPPRKHCPADEEIARTWPRFRGPGGLGISAYTNVPQTWDAKSGKGIVWKTPVPLPGNNSPVVWGKRVFLSGADQRRREVYCFDAERRQAALAAGRRPARRKAPPGRRR